MVALPLVYSFYLGDTDGMITNQMSLDLSIAATPIAPQSAAPGSVDTGGIDMVKFRRAIFILDVGNFGADATVDMKLQESNASDFSSGVSDIAGAVITQLLAAGGNNRLASIEVNSGQLSKRYVRARVITAVAASTLQCLALGGNENNSPASQYDIASVVQRVRLTTGIVGPYSIHSTSTIVNEL